MNKLLIYRVTYKQIFLIAMAKTFWEKELVNIFCDF